MQDSKTLRIKLKDTEKELKSLRSESQKDFVENKSNAVLGTKLRKYAEHCQRLEAEKATIIDVIKSSSVACLQEMIEHPDEDISSSILSVCERLQSVERECRDLSKYKEKAISCTKELELLRCDNEKLEKNMTNMEENVEKLRTSETSLISKLNSAEKHLNDLRKQRNDLQKMVKNAKGNAADLQTEKGRQVRYLEQENLQLMQELKTAKRDLQKIKAKLKLFENEESLSKAMSLNAIKVASPVSESQTEKENEKPIESIAKKSTSTAKETSQKSPFSDLKRDTSKISFGANIANTSNIRLGVDNEVGEDDTVGECNQS